MFWFFWLFGGSAAPVVAGTPVRINYPSGARRNTIEVRDTNAVPSDGRSNVPRNEP